MFDISKRTGFHTVGELMELLRELPPYTTVCICGDSACFYHEEKDQSAICLDCEDLDAIYREQVESGPLAEGADAPPAVVAPLAGIDTLAERDKLLEQDWQQFAALPMDPETERMEEPFLTFPAGTHREEIWRWFDERHSKGVAYLLYGANPDSTEDSPLTRFFQQEVPCRLQENLSIPDEIITPEVLQECIDTLDENSDLLFRHDKIDEMLEEVLRTYGIDPELYRGG